MFVAIKMIPLVLMALSLAFPLSAQNRKYSTFWHQRVSLFEKLAVTNEDILFVGNSITNGGEWAELFHNLKVKNRGISGDICMGVYDRLLPLLKGGRQRYF